MSFVIATSELDSIKNITTPLALAALCFIVGAGIIRLLVKDRNSKNNRLIIQWGFALAAALSMAANVSFLIVASYQREIRISGVVHDSTGVALPRAIVDIPGKGRGITDDYGEFEFDIPDARADNDYVVDVSLRGYKSQEAKMEGRQPRPLRINLDAVVLDTSTLISVRRDVLIRHYLGIPLVTVPLSFENPLGHDITVDSPALILVGPDGTERRLIPQFLQVTADGPSMPPLPSLAVPQNSSVSFFWVFGDNIGAELGGLAAKANQQFMLTEYRPPDPSKKVYSDDVIRDLQAFMQAHFLWKPGNWKAVITCNADGRHFEKVFFFTLSDAQVSSMKLIKDFYQAGIGVVSPWLYVPAGGANPTAIVSWTVQ